MGRPWLKTLTTMFLVTIVSSLAQGCQSLWGLGSLDSSATVAKSSKPFLLCMVLPGPIDDGSWSESGYRGLTLSQEKLGATVRYVAKTDGQSADRLIQTFRDLAKGGCDLLIGHGAQYDLAVSKVADEFPRVKFALTSSHPGNNRNLGGLGFRYGELGYLLGIVSAMKTKTGTISVISGEDIVPIRDEVKLLTRAARSIRPGTIVRHRSINSWTDADRAERLAREEVAQGADILIPIVNTADRGVVRVAEGSGAHVIGWVTDRYTVSPKTVITSGLQDISIMILRAVRLAREGRWEGKQYRFGIEEGVQAIAPFRGALSAAEEKRFRAIEQEVVSGQIDVSPVSP